MEINFFWGNGSSADHSNRSKLSKKTKYICQTGAFAAIYVVLTCLFAMIPLGEGIQFRPAEALCVLAYYTPAVVPGMTIGCFLANLLTTSSPMDVIFGTIATFIGVLAGRLIRHSGKWLIALPTVIANVLILPPVITWAYGVEEAFLTVFIFVAVSEIVSAYLLGGVLLYSLRKGRGRKLLRIG